MLNTYRLTIEKLDANGVAVESHVVTSGAGTNRKMLDDGALAYVLCRAAEAMTSPGESPPDLYGTTYELIANLAYSTECPVLRALTDAHRRWSCDQDFADCVRVVVDEAKLTAGNEPEDE